MKIESIEGINVKGRSFEHSFEDLNVICGKNASGKTAITDAITIALLGYHPKLGKTNKATAKLAGAGAVMEVAAAFEDDSYILRRWELKRTSTSLKSEGTAKDIELEIGSFDVDAFIQAPLTQKLETIARTLPAAASNVSPAAFAEKISQADNAHLVSEWTGGGSTFEAQRKEAEEIRRDLNAEKKMLQETIAGLELLGLDDEQKEPPTTEEIAAAEATLENNTKELNIKTVRLAELKSKQASQPSQGEPTDELLGQLEHNYATAMEMVEYAQQNAAEHQMSAATALRLRQEIEDLQTKHEREIAKAESDLEYEVVNSEIAPTKLEELRDTLTGNKNILQKEEQELIKLNAEYDDLVNSDECPCCKRKGEGFKKAIKKAADDAISKVENSIKTRKKKITKAEKELEELTYDLAILSGRSALIAISEKKKELQEISQNTGVADVAQLKAKMREASAALQARMDIKKQWEFYRQFSSQSNQIPELESDINACEEKVYESKTALQSLRNEREQLSKQIHDRQRQAESRSRLTAIEAEYKAFNALIKKIKEAELKAAKAALKPMAKVTKVFLDGVVDGQLAMQDAEIGIVRQKQFINFWTLSGAEQLAVGCAIKAAIANASVSKILIADEVARMTADLREQFAKNCKKAIEQKIIDQAFLIDHEGAIAIGNKIEVA